jgi:hypothetical protein
LVALGFDLDFGVVGLIGSILTSTFTYFLSYFCYLAGVFFVTVFVLGLISFLTGAFDGLGAFCIFLVFLGADATFFLGYFAFFAVGFLAGFFASVFFLAF